MFDDLYVNDALLPEPTGNLKFSNKKVKTESETEAGTTVVIVTRPEKITVSGKWQVSGTWLGRFRAWARENTVQVRCYFPDVDRLTEHECQLTISDEEHETRAREQLPETNGLYTIQVTLEEL